VLVNFGTLLSYRFDKIKFAQTNFRINDVFRKIFQLVVTYKSNLIELHSRDILQINATLMTGAFIFLTLSSFAPTPAETVYRLSSIALAIGMMICFATSSMSEMRGLREKALKNMQYGFIFIFIMSMIFFVLNYAFVVSKSAEISHWLLGSR
jgi:hypothetical protein